MAEKPLMLKDYLAIESSMESFRWASLQRAWLVGGGRITVRGLLETEIGSGGGADYRGWRLVRFRSKGVLTKLSDVIRILHPSIDDAPSSAAESGGGAPRFVYKTFSKRLRRGFWKKRDRDHDNEGKVMAKDQSDSGHLLFLSPDASKCISSSDNRREQKDICGKDMDCGSEEEKEQLSPVSVMDFPYPDGDDDEEPENVPATSPSFEKSVATIERTKNQLLQKIRRLESLASLEPIHLDQLFTYTYAYGESAVHVATEERRRRTALSLLCRFKCGEPLPACGEKLLFDFFVEGLSSNGRGGDEELVQEAEGWISSGRATAAQEGGVELWEMDRRSVGWRRFAEEEEAAAVEISCGLLARLTAEVVDDLFLAKLTN